MGRHVYDHAGRDLGIVEAVATAKNGRLHRLGIRADAREDRLRFHSAEGVKFHLNHVVLPVVVAPPERFRLFLDPRRRALLRTR
jgi:hypothetical protein